MELKLEAYKNLWQCAKFFSSITLPTNEQFQIYSEFYSLLLPIIFYVQFLTIGSLDKIRKKLGENKENACTTTGAGQFSLF